MGNKKINYCQACGMCLSDLSYYFNRFKVCNQCHKKDEVNIKGETLRFCNKCGRFEELNRFDGLKKSCRIKLEQHNRLRKGKQRGSAKQQSSQNLITTEYNNNNNVQSFLFQQQQQQQQMQQTSSYTNTLENDKSQNTSQFFHKNGIQNSQLLVNQSSLQSSLETEIEYLFLKLSIILGEKINEQTFRLVCDNQFLAQVFTIFVKNEYYRGNFNQVQMNTIIDILENYRERIKNRRN
eukprot:TRINITY_DN6540_c0_g3_i1.p1 TRINITY_DN6540_c0_g3~~TRINITY_DN6540_c0_g3_i1.p1  ORF type:complete len:237 (+),score=13.57 TRINITY_DN6540_c0_g3_i1:231-941(+)